MFPARLPFAAAGRGPGYVAGALLVIWLAPAPPLLLGGLARVRCDASCRYGLVQVGRPFHAEPLSIRAAIGAVHHALLYRRGASSRWRPSWII